MNGPGRRLPNELVDEADVGEGSPGHDGVVATTGAVRVELARCHALGAQELGRRAVPGDATGWADVVGSYGVAEIKENPAWKGAGKLRTL